MNNYLISYDISNNRLRQKIADLLTQKGCVRLQKSVHLAPGFEMKELEQLKKSLAPLLEKFDAETDSLLCIAAPNETLETAWLAGNSAALKKITQPPLHNLL